MPGPFVEFLWKKSRLLSIDQHETRGLVAAIILIMIMQNIRSFSKDN